jgi:hypothetical protein
LPVLFAATLFVSAVLLFLVQPMIAKMILPLLGGMPAVWITCLLFYQTVLLAGYFYAHAVSRRLPPRRQVLLHIAVVVFPALTLPLLLLPWQLLQGDASAGPGAWLGLPPTEASPVPWLLGLLGLSVGLPFFALSTTAPLLQRWFAQTGHPSARDPYFLYGASNLGSMLALLGYPLLVEPSLGLTRQGTAWMIGYGVLVLLVAGCALVVGRQIKDEGGRMKDEKEKAPAEIHPSSFIPHPSSATPGQRFRWMALAFVPSGLLYGVTTFLSTDLPAVPLLWIIPLALYLLTFILVFSRWKLVPHRLVVWLVPVLILVQLGQVLGELIDPNWAVMLIHLLLFFSIALFCHGELARSRPPVEHLTEFYLWLSIGGVLGGVFNVLVAPLLFSLVSEYPVFALVSEYPLEIALACLFVPQLARERKPGGELLNVGLPLGAGVVAAALLVLLFVGREVTWLRCFLLLSPAIAVYLVVAYFSDRPLLFGLSVELILLVAVTGVNPLGQVIYRERSFYGILLVTRDAKGQYLQLFHGGTCHGKERLTREPEERDVPRTHYYPTGPIGQVFAAFTGTQAKPYVGVVGLGAGSLASYGQHGQEMTFFEIDPHVVWVARDSGYFTYLRDSRATIRCELGDGRRSLAREPDGKYGLLVLDAFTSDAVPIHLLTREAVRDVYLRKLTDDGLLAFHISNRYLDLRPVLADLAEELHLVCRVEVDPGDESVSKEASTWVIMARKPEHLGLLARDPRWQDLPGQPGGPVWRDDYSDPLRLFWWNSVTPTRRRGSEGKP